MLRELHISNLAVIEDATLELGPGFNVFTGQTGAGKSLILGAFELLLGLRSGAGLLRDGADEGRVVGAFEIADDALARAAAEAADLTLHPGDEVLITRKLFASGRTSVSLNGQPTTAAIVRRLGRLLVDIHGQHDHQSLLRPASQLDILDDFGECGGLRRRFAERFHDLQAMRKRKAELDASRSLRQQQLELYAFQAQEIDDAEPTAGEFPELHARHHVLSNSRRLQGEAGQVHSALYESDGSVVERLEVMTQVLRDLAEIDGELTPIAEQVRDATAAAREASFDLSRYVDRLEYDPDELGEVESRLNTLNRLIQKYADAPRGGSGDAAGGDDPLWAVLDYREHIQAEIDHLRQASDDLDHLDDRIAASEGELQRIGGELTAARKTAAEALVPAVEAELPELGMPDAKLEIAFEPIDPASGDATPAGLERVEWNVRTNPGQAMRPMRKIASGGELSRLTLAIKGVLAASDRTSVLVFDEIDANIGGRLGSVIGRKLLELCHAGHAPHPHPDTGPVAGADAHQVLCITHLPQIAAFANRHFRIEKAVAGRGKQRSTRTTVARMAGKARVDELAEMLAGAEATPTTRRQAKELLGRAEAVAA